jgi:hypothetical protein
MQCVFVDTHTKNTAPAKYLPLTEFLRRQSGTAVRMSFVEIERVIGARLPRSATTHRAWWSNNPENNVMTKAWREAGFESEDVDMKGQQVTFRRVRSGRSRDAGVPAVVTPGERHPLIGWMKGTLTIPEGVDLTQPADPDWGDAAYGDRARAERK